MDKHSCSPEEHIEGITFFDKTGIDSDIALWIVRRHDRRSTNATGLKIGRTVGVPRPIDVNISNCDVAGIVAPDTNDVDILVRVKHQARRCPCPCEEDIAVFNNDATFKRIAIGANPIRPLA